MRNILPGRIAIVLLLPLLSSCNVPKGDQGPIGPSGRDAPTDKQIRLDFPLPNFATADTAGALLTPFSYLVAFNKTNYAYVDSIVFGASIATSDTSVSCVAELYDVTDGAVIANSAISTKSTAVAWRFSGNTFAGIPGKTIDLSLRVRSSRLGVSVTVYSAVLLLYRE